MTSKKTDAILQEKKEYSKHILQALRVWNETLGFNNVRMSHEIEQVFNKGKSNQAKISCTESTISRACHQPSQVSIKALKQLLTAINTILEKYQYFYHELPQKYVYGQVGSATISDDLKEDFPERLVGIYAIFHLGSHAKTITKNILVIEANGSAKMYGTKTIEYVGRAQVLLNNALVFHFTHTQKQAFYIQIHSHLGSWLSYDAEEIHFIPTMCVTWQPNNHPLCMRRLMVKLDDSIKLTKQYQPTSIPVMSANYEAINQEYKGLCDYLLGPTNNILLTDLAVNQMEQFRAKKDFGQLYFDAACYAAHQKRYKESRDRLWNAFLHGFKDSLQCKEAEEGALNPIFKDWQKQYNIKKLIDIRQEVFRL